MTDFGTFKIAQIILHRVPGGKANPDGPDEIEYSEAPIELRPRDKAFIELKMRETLGGRARPVIEDKELGSPTPDVVRGLLSGGGDLVGDSAGLARRLHSKQKWISPLGLVMVIEGKLQQASCLVVAKMEHEEGMRVQPTKDSSGRRTYRAEYLRDLFLVERTRVFKAGVFTSEGVRKDALLTGDVVDEQQPGGGIAEYFVEFLGCKFVQQADVQTETFMKEAQRFIVQNTKGNPEATAEYEIALLSEMQNQAARIVPEAFARTHLHEEDRDAFVSRMQQVGLPLKGFRKDVSLVAKSIRRMKVQTVRGATVYVPPEMYEDGSLTVVDTDDDESQITVIDKISGISGASGPKPQAG